jgi:hypothetical protein
MEHLDKIIMLLIILGLSILNFHIAYSEFKKGRYKNAIINCYASGFCFAFFLIGVLFFFKLYL